VVVSHALTKEQSVTDNMPIVTTRRDDVVSAIARQAPALTEQQRARLAALLKPKAGAR
jgi:hypothetical protein